MMLDRDRANAIAQKLMVLSTADDAVVHIEGGRRTHLRWANNQCTTSGVDHDVTVKLTVSFGQRSGTAEVNQVDDASLKELVARAETLAKLSPEDPEHMPSMGSQVYLGIAAWRPTEREDALQNGVSSVIGEAERTGLISAGFALTHRRFTSINTKNGASGWHRWTDATASTTARTADGQGSGWAIRTGSRMDELPFDELGTIAAQKAQRSKGRKPLEPGRYVTVLEPSCVANLMGILKRALDRRKTDEGRSFLSRPGGGDALGEPLFPSWITAGSHPNDQRVQGLPFTDAGQPQQPRTWIQEGRIISLPCSRYWAKKTGKSHVPQGDTWIASGQDATLEELIAGTDRGVLVTSLWYIRPVDPRKLLYTGLTRDGLFWIEDGQISHPLTNMRWNDSPIDVLAKAVDATRPQRASPRGQGGGRMVVPALKTEAFHFTSVSDAV